MSKFPFTEEAESRFKSLESGTLGGPTSTETSTTNGGALSTNVLVSNIATAGAETRTLAAPTQDGQMKLINMSVNGGNATIALTNFDTGTTATFSAVGHSLLAISVGGKWRRFGGSAVIT